MSDRKKKPEAFSRRDALRLMGTAVPLNVALISMLSEEIGAVQVPTPRNLRLVTFEPAANSPLALGQHPRSYLTPAMLTSLRAKIASDTAFKARWQTAVSQFEEAGGYWAKEEKDPFLTAFGAVLACIRRPDNDLGLSWATSWSTLRNRVVSSAQGMTHGNGYAPTVWMTAMVYDLLYHDLTPAERTQFSAWVTFDANDAGTVSEHWADQDADDFVANSLAALVADDASKRLAKVWGDMQAWAESRAWMSFANGITYDVKEPQPTQIGPVIALWLIKNATGASAAETTDLYLPVLRDSWQLLRQFSVPHPAQATSDAYWYNDHVNMSGATDYVHHSLRIAPTMVWALALLPGRVESWVLPYLQNEYDHRGKLRRVTNFKWISTDSSTSDQGNAMTFYAFVPWLLLNAQTVTPSTAGVPLVRRWWPATLEWTTIRSSISDNATSSMISYHHRKYHLAGYEQGCRQNASWHAHRAGPLLVQRGEGTHTVTTRFWTLNANGTVTFIDTTTPENTAYINSQIYDNGGVRPGPDADTRAEAMAARPASDYGDVTAWYADDKVVAISSELTKSYNSASYAHDGGKPGNEPKISAFTREFVVVQRGGDGTSHERIFTYDRLAILGGGRYLPQYNLCPGPPQIDIDGVETAYTPWRADATGPTRWDYANATRLIVDNTVEPVITPRGSGKACVTWLRPSGNGVRIRKRGGLAVTSPQETPFFTQYGAPMKPDLSDWNRTRDMDKRAYCGLYRVEVIPATFSADTRFLIVADLMNATDSPSLAAELSCDAGSVAARCGASAVVFGKEAGSRAVGNVTIPSGVALVVLVNLPAGATRTLSASGGLSITTAGRAASSSGVLTVGVGGSGVLSFG